MKITNFIIKSLMIVVLCFLLKTFIMDIVSLVNPSLSQKSIVSFWDSRDKLDYIEVYKNSVKDCEEEFECGCSMCQKNKAECLNKAEKIKNETAAKLRKSVLMDLFISALNIAIWFLAWFLLDRLFSYVYNIDSNKSDNVKKIGKIFYFGDVNMEKFVNYSGNFIKISVKLFLIAVVCVLMKNIFIDTLNLIKPGIVGYEQYRYYNIEYLSNLKECEDDFNAGSCINSAKQKRDVNLEKARADITSSLLNSIIYLFSVVLFVVLLRVMLKWNIIPSFDRSLKK